MTERFTVVHQGNKRSEVGDIIGQLTENFRIPDQFTLDLVLEITGKYTEFQYQAKRLRIDLTHSVV